MSRLLTERLASLRKEIAELRSPNGLKKLGTYQEREALLQRREERLREIMEELRSLRGILSGESIY
jgi:hypothetical protein